MLQDKCILCGTHSHFLWIIGTSGLGVPLISQPCFNPEAREHKQRRDVKDVSLTATVSNVDGAKVPDVVPLWHLFSCLWRSAS